MNHLRNRSVLGNWVRIGALAAAGLAVTSARALEIRVQPGSAIVAPGGGVEISLVIRGLGTGVAPSLGGFDLNLSFDPGVLTYDSLTFGDPTLGNQLALTFPSLDGSTVDPVAGLVNLFSVSLDSVADLEDLQEDSFVMASLHFTAVGAGLSSLGLSAIQLTDAVGGGLIPDRVFDGLVQVGGNTVPEGGNFYPGVFLLVFGAGCTWVQRRRNGTVGARVE